MQLYAYRRGGLQTRWQQNANSRRREARILGIRARNCVEHKLLRAGGRKRTCGGAVNHPGPEARQSLPHEQQD